MAFTIVATVTIVGPLFLGAGSGAAAPGFSFALVGDIPYSASDVTAMATLVRRINDDPGVQFVAHAGDTKAASAACTDTTMSQRFDLFQGLDDPFWFTPGDNDWTDCREGDRTADPIERLAFLRSLYYPTPSRTTGGAPMSVTPQSATAGFAKYVENVSFERQCATFGSIHQVGSSNGLVTWPNETEFERELRLAEVEQRIAANVAWVDAIFDRAAAASSTGVVLLVHAKPQNAAGWTEVRNRIVARAGAFDGNVVVAHGDHHTQAVEPGFLGLPNVTRWEMKGGTGATNQWVRATVDCSGPDAVFTQEVVPTNSPPGTTSTTIPSTTTTVRPTTTTTTIPSTTTTTVGPTTTTTLRPTTTTTLRPTTTVPFRIERGATVGASARRGARFVVPIADRPSGPR